MRLALISDTHFGARSDSEAISNFQRKFYQEVFLPYLKPNNIENVVMLGDVFERRKYINFRTLDAAYDMFFIPLESSGVNLHLMSGNHDVFYRNTNRINSVRLLLSSFKNVKSITDFHPIDMKFGNDYVLLVPWITEDNYDECMRALQTSHAPVVFGHFDINGFEMAPGALCESGLETNVFYRFDHVYSGHYHIKSSKGNITYLGTQYQMDWGDYGQIKGFHVYDTETKEIEFVPNPNSIFVRIVYDERKDMASVFDVVGKFVKVVVTERNDLYRFEKWLEKLTNQAPEDIQIIEQQMVVDIQNITDDTTPRTTMDILNEYVDKIENIPQQTIQKSKSLLRELYTEAQNV